MKCKKLSFFVNEKKKIICSIIEISFLKFFHDSNYGKTTRKHEFSKCSTTSFGSKYTKCPKKVLENFHNSYRFFIFCFFCFAKKKQKKQSKKMGYAQAETKIMYVYDIVWTFVKTREFSHKKNSFSVKIKWFFFFFKQNHWCNILNRLIFSKSSHRREGLAPRCRLITSWGCSRSQGLGCSPMKVVRELGSERKQHCVYR